MLLTELCCIHCALKMMTWYMDFYLDLTWTWSQPTGKLKTLNHFCQTLDKTKPHKFIKPEWHYIYNLSFALYKQFSTSSSSASST